MEVQMSNLEKEFQKNIITRIVGENGFEISQDSNYNTKYALDDSKLINFLSNSTKSNKERLIELQKKYPNT
ncbi:hypothetical protein FACS189459_2400 [Bacilli bacterium]|nr:hypothetical protein FACS189459_2400 [Bacilli bacterium]